MVRLESAFLIANLLEHVDFISERDLCDYYEEIIVSLADDPRFYNVFIGFEKIDEDTRKKLAIYQHYFVENNNGYKKQIDEILESGVFTVRIDYMDISDVADRYDFTQIIKNTAKKVAEKILNQNS